MQDFPSSKPEEKLEKKLQTFLNFDLVDDQNDQKDNVFLICKVLTYSTPGKSYSNLYQYSYCIDILPAKLVEETNFYCKRLMSDIPFLFLIHNIENHWIFYIDKYF